MEEVEEPVREDGPPGPPPDDGRREDGDRYDAPDAHHGDGEPGGSRELPDGPGEHHADDGDGSRQQEQNEDDRQRDGGVRPGVELGADVRLGRGPVRTLRVVRLATVVA